MSGLADAVMLQLGISLAGCLSGAQTISFLFFFFSEIESGHKQNYRGEGLT